MPKNQVFLFPGWGASDLAAIRTGLLVWWNWKISQNKGLQALALSPDGTTPLPPEGEQMGVSLDLQDPWGRIKDQLDTQLDQDEWRTTVVPYDWRLDPILTAAELADSLRRTTTPAFPATLVGHSLGGLVCYLCWCNLIKTGETALIRRIVTIATPFQGSYLPVMWLIGTLAISQRLSTVPAAGQWNPLFNYLLWTVDALNSLALTWPSFYALFPALNVPYAQIDPDRVKLYASGNYPARWGVQQKWLDYARNTLQPILYDTANYPPWWIMSNVVGGGLATPVSLVPTDGPLKLDNLISLLNGDSVVSGETQQIATATKVFVSGDHFSLPLGIAKNTLLSQLILAETRPPDPPTPPEFVGPPIPANVTAPPDPEPITGLVCVWGG